MEELVMLYYLLKRAWPRRGWNVAPKNVLQGSQASVESFRYMLDWWDPEEHIDKGLARAFVQAIRRNDQEAKAAGVATLRDRFEELCSWFARTRQHVPPDENDKRNWFIGELRALLGATCIHALQPDLVILDEFQRFRELLIPHNPAGSLARHLFAWGEARVLLLSATPYKMLTLSHEIEAEDHYEGFV